MDYEAVIGLEIHMQLNCATKMFCQCPNRPGDRPNRNTCPICLWLPGALPRFSQQALEKAVLTCLALHCEINRRSAFDQKVYYYPDLPKGFQLSQFHKQLAHDGWLDIPGEDGRPKRLRIREIHMEEDVAKLVHETEGGRRISLVDFNRAGAPLVEIVSEPDLRTPHDAMEFLRALRTQIRYVGAAECSMESGTLRADANVSLRPRGSDELRTKVEVKNMNSIRHVGDAIAHEIGRQAERLRAGESIVLHTRLWDPVKAVTTPMRGKFSGPCVPDPSVPEIVIREEWLAQMRARLPEMPARKRERFVREHGLTLDEATLMSAERETAEYFEATLRAGAAPRAAAQTMATQLLPALKDHGQSPADTPVTPPRLAELLALAERGEINANAAKEVLARLFEDERAPADIVEEHGYRQLTDTAQLDALIDKVLAENPAAARDFRSGRTQALGFLVGQAVRASQGTADPKLLRQLLDRKLT